jgi:hypothetical protein
VLLTLDHLIIRTGDPRATLAELAERLAAPVLAGVVEAAGFASGILRAGALDLEVLQIGAAPPAGPQGYGLGFTADVPLVDASATLRSLGFPTSAAARASADARSWRAVQVHGLLPDPFPVPVTTRKPGFVDRAAGAMAQIPVLAKAATRKAGRSMVVVTDYEFDAAAWRANAGHGPEVIAVEIGTGGHDWSELPLAPGPLELRASGPTGIRRIVFEGDADSFTLGDVEFEFSSAA